MNYILGTAWETGVHDMATWKEKFEDLSAENGRQLSRWNAGESNHNELRTAIEAISEFLRQYLSSGEPDRDEEMP